jgi:hypothetical protein
VLAVTNALPDSEALAELLLLLWAKVGELTAATTGVSRRASRASGGWPGSPGCSSR